MNVDKIKSRCGAPMSDETRLHVLFPEWLLEQRVVVEIGLADGQIIGGAPPCVYFAKEARVERILLRDRNAPPGAGEARHARAVDAAAGFLASRVHSVVLNY